MNNAAVQTSYGSSSKSMDTLDFAKKVAREAVPDMLKHGVAPTPQNYASGRNKQLSHKINRLKETVDQFSPAISQTLYDDFISDQATQLEIERNSYSAKTLLADLLELMEGMSGETDSYNKKLDGYIDRLGGEYESDANLKQMVKELVERTSQMRVSGGDLHNKLIASQREAELLRANIERITEEANRDTLTGLSNRKVFDSSMAELAKHANEDNSVFSLLMVDIDHFKNFNDKFGHLVGDEVLKIVAKELLNSVKGRDIAARYGGEEFGVILPGTPLSGALIVGENIRKSISERELTRKDTKESYGPLTVSIGVAQYHGKSDKVTDMIKRADDALYRSKKGGRNRVTHESSGE